MERYEFPTDIGQAEVCATNSDSAHAVLQFALQNADARETGLMTSLGGVRVWFKGGQLRGKAARRHALRRHVLRLDYPRIQELRNLEWLRARLFHAPRPVAAGVVTRNGVPRYQFLATEFVEDAISFRELLEQADDRRRLAALPLLAREFARMHALGFVHRDLYPRNLLLRHRNQHEEVIFLDAWRGGAGPGWRGADHDLACFLLHGADWLSAEEQRVFLGDYFEARRAQDRPVDAERFLPRIARNRHRLRQRLAERPHERRGQALPSADWHWPSLD